MNPQVGSARSKSDRAIHRSRTFRVVLEVAAGMPPGSSTLAIRRAVSERCRAVGLEPPSRRSVAATLGHLERTGPTNAFRLQLSIDFCALALDTRRWNDPSNLVGVGLAMLEPSRHVVAHRILVGSPTLNDTLALLLAAIERHESGSRARLDLPTGADSWHVALRAAAADARIPITTRRAADAAYGAAARRILGRNLGGLALRPRGIAKRNDRRCAITAAEWAIVDDAVARHNAARPSRVPHFWIGRDRTFLDALRALAARAERSALEPGTPMTGPTALR